MLTIKNYTNIIDKTFGDWIIKKAEEKFLHYEFQAFHNENSRNISIVLFRDTKMDLRVDEDMYQLAVLEDGKQGIVDELLYQSVVEDMQLFGETLLIYFNTI